MLSKREKEVVKLVAEGHKSKLIAQLLNISIHTVHTHRKNIIQKTKTKTSCELVRFALINELV